MSGPLLYYAPGAGLGHLTRALAICLPLRHEGIDARIVTDSPFAPGVAALARCPIMPLAANLEAAMVITDAFPFGLRGEWRESSMPLLHIARRLRVREPVPKDRFVSVIEAEPLGIEGAVRQPGPIRLPPGRIRTKIPPELDRSDLTLVVHSGPLDEVDRLIALAQDKPTVIAPFAGIDYYPAQNLYERARRVITGAGYNAMTDMLWHREKHTAIAFDRNHDDQHARFTSFFEEPIDGTSTALEAVKRAWRAFE